MTIDVIIPAELQKIYDDWHFAPAVRHGDLLFCSGVIGNGDSADEEFRDAWQAIGRTLAEGGAGYADIIDTTLYIVDLAKNAGAMAKVKDEFIKAPYPASTWIGVAGLINPKARAEIKVIARVPS